MALTVIRATLPRHTFKVISDNSDPYHFGADRKQFGRPESNLARGLPRKFPRTCGKLRPALLSGKRSWEIWK